MALTFDWVRVTIKFIANNYVRKPHAPVVVSLEAPSFKIFVFLMRPVGFLEVHHICVMFSWRFRFGQETRSSLSDLVVAKIHFSDVMERSKIVSFPIIWVFQCPGIHQKGTVFLASNRYLSANIIGRRFSDKKRNLFHAFFQVNI